MTLLEAFVGAVRRRSLTESAVSLLPTVFLLVTVGIPFGFFLWGSFWSTTPGFGGQFTLAGYETALTHPTVRGILGNTLVLGLLGTLSAVVIGLLTMVYTLKMDGPRWLQSAVSAIMIVQLLMPTFIQGLAWNFYLGPNGPVNTVLMLLPVIDSPVVSANNIWTISFIFGTHYAGLVYLLTSGAVRSIPPSLEEIGLISGARTRAIFTAVDFPLILPSLFIAGVIVFSRAIQSFGLPLVLGLPDGVYVLATLMYLELSEYPTNFTFIAAVGIIILLLSLGLLWLQRRISGPSERYETLRGAGERTEALRFFQSRAFGTLFLAFVALAYLLPILMMVLGSLQQAWVGLNSQFVEWSLEGYRLLFSTEWSDLFYSSILNSALLGTVTASFALLLAMIISYLSVKTDRRLGSFLNYLSYTPLVIPGIVLASALQWMLLEYNDVLGFLYGSFTILVVAYAAKFLVYGVRAANSSLRAVGSNLEEMGRISGASRLTIAREIYAPLMRPGLLSGFLIIFIDTTKSLSIAVILGGDGGVKIVQSAIWHLISQGEANAAAAYSVILTLILVAVYVVAYRLGIEITSI